MNVSLTAMTVLLTALCTWLQAADYFVAPDGSDDNPGTIAAPLATIQNGVRRLMPGDTLYLREGRYHEDVKLDGVKGQPGKPITIRSYGGEKVVLDGTVAIEAEWTRYKGSVWKATIDRDIWQLFVDGRMMTSARWPNVRMWTDEMWSRRGWRRQGGVSAYGHLVDDETWQPDDTLAAQGKSFEGAIAILNLEYWETAARVVKNHRPGTVGFDYDADCMRNPSLFKRFDRTYGSWFFLECHLACLDTAEEWYLDPETKTLYLWPDDGGNPSGRDVRGKTQTYALDLSDCAHVVMRDLGFFATTFRATNCTNLIVEDCNLRYPSYSKRMLRDTRRPEVTLLKARGKRAAAGHVIRNCEFAYTDGTALEIWGRDNLIENCWFHDIDYSCVGNWSVGTVSTFFTRGLVFRRNTIERGGNSETVPGGDACKIELNRITACGMLQGDGAGIQFTTRGQKDSIVARNWVHDAAKRGIRFDDSGGPPQPMGREGTIHHNVVWNTPYQGFMVKGDFHRVCNNTGFACRQPTMVVLVAANQNAVNDHTLTSSNAIETIAKHWTNSRLRPIPGEVTNNWIDSERGLDIRTQLRDPANLDFRPEPGSALVDAGRIVPGITGSYVGKAPDIGAYEYGDENYWIPGRRLDRACTPVPPNGSTAVKTDADLMWLGGRQAQKHRVYFGLGFDALEFRNEQANNVFCPGPLRPGQISFWRIDTLTGDGRTITGEVWRFTTRAPRKELDKSR